PHLQDRAGCFLCSAARLPASRVFNRHGPPRIARTRAICRQVHPLRLPSRLLPIDLFFTTEDRETQRETTKSTTKVTKLHEGTWSRHVFVILRVLCGLSHFVFFRFSSC